MPACFESHETQAGFCFVQSVIIDDDLVVYPQPTAVVGTQGKRVDAVPRRLDQPREPEGVTVLFQRGSQGDPVGDTGGRGRQGCEVWEFFQSNVVIIAADARFRPNAFQRRQRFVVAVRGQVFEEVFFVIRQHGSHSPSRSSSFRSAVVRNRSILARSAG